MGNKYRRQRSKEDVANELRSIIDEYVDDIIDDVERLAENGLVVLAIGVPRPLATLFESAWLGHMDIPELGIPYFGSLKLKEEPKFMSTFLQCSTHQTNELMAIFVREVEPERYGRKAVEFLCGSQKCECCMEAKLLLRKIMWAGESVHHYVAYGPEEAAELDATGTIRDYQPPETQRN